MHSLPSLRLCRSLSQRGSNTLKLRAQVICHERECPGQAAAIPHIGLQHPHTATQTEGLLVIPAAIPASCHPQSAVGRVLLPQHGVAEVQARRTAQRMVRRGRALRSAARPSSSGEQRL